MKNQPDLLAYYAEMNAAFLHSYGESATEKLLKMLNAKNGEGILEIGYGTGATLVKVAARNNNIRLFGLEYSTRMFEQAVRRLKFSGVKNKISIRKAEGAEQFPYETNSMDKVFSESVLAIQSEDRLHKIISEINRILKPGGLFILNETLWLPAITQKEIDQLNDYCRQQFGMIQCNGTYAYAESWKSLLAEHGFEVVSIDRIEDLKAERPSFNLHEFLSRCFTWSGKIKMLFHAELRREFKFYKEGMNKMFGNKKYLQGTMMVAQSTKTR